MTTPSRRQAAAAAGLVVLAVLGTPGAAAARPDAGTSVQNAPGGATKTTGCPLRRIGDQLVVCDNLTGAGVTAPRWVPEA